MPEKGASYTLFSEDGRVSRSKREREGRSPMRQKKGPRCEQARTL